MPVGNKPPYPRARQRSSIAPVPFNRKQVTFGGTTTVSPVNRGTCGVYEVMEDVVTPGYARRVASGDIVNSPCKRVREEYGVVGGGYQHKYVGPPLSLPGNAQTVILDRFDNLLVWKLGAIGSSVNHSGNYLNLELITAADIERTITLAATKALSNFNRSDAQALVFLGELGESLTMLRNPVQALYKYLQKPWRYTRNVKLLGKGRKKVTRVLDPVAEIIPLGDAAANQYLTWYYGLRPFMKDIEDAVEAIKKLYKVRRKTSAKEVLVRNSSAQLPLHSGTALINVDYLRKMDESVEVKCGLLFKPQITTAGQAFGVSLNAVPSAVFELIPWSFTSSWVSNLGTFVNALAVMYSSDILSEYCTIVKRKRVDRFCLPGSFVIAPTWLGSPCQDGDWYTAEEYTRFPINLSARAGVVFQSPDWKLPQTLAAASLAIQQLVGKTHKLLKG